MIKLEIVTKWGDYMVQWGLTVTKSYLPGSFIFHNHLQKV